MGVNEQVTPQEKATDIILKIEKIQRFEDNVF